LTAQHASSDIIAHHQELLNCNYSLEASDNERQYRSKHVEQSKYNGILVTIMTAAGNNKRV
jgi:hypothetical protein